jgi:membrane associated rhomboid family serine protease
VTASATYAAAPAAARARARLDFPLTLAIAVAAVTVTAVAFATGPAAAPARWLIAGGTDIAHGEIWRLATGPFVHATWGHLVRDLALVLIPGVAYEAVFGRRWRIVVGLGLIAPAAAVLASGVPAYYGLSGLSHAVLAAALAFELRHRRGAIRIYVAALTAAGVVKIAYELFGGTPTFPMDLGPGVYQVPLAHAVGGVVGLALGWTTATGLSTPRSS